MRRTLVAALSLTALACGGLGSPGPGVPTALRGQWYRDGRLLEIQEHAIGDWKPKDRSIPGTFANDTFLFEPVPFRARGTRGPCSGSLALKSGRLVVDLTGPCEELDGTWSRDASGARAKTASSAPKAPAPTPAPAAPSPIQPVSTPPQPSSVDWCARYVSCVCDVATNIRYRAGDESYMASCDVARVLVDLGTSADECRIALRDMQGWFSGIEMAYAWEGVAVPAHCKGL